MAYIAGVNRPVDTGDTYFAEISTALAHQTLMMRDRIKKIPSSELSPLFAKVNFGRWIVPCPNCNNVEFAFEDNLFLCTQCNNGDGKPRQVMLPTERKQIEEILGKRMIVNRHWIPTETINTLLAENIANRIEGA